MRGRSVSGEFDVAVDLEELTSSSRGDSGPEKWNGSELQTPSSDMWVMRLYVPAVPTSVYMMALTGRQNQLPLMNLAPEPQRLPVTSRMKRVLPITPIILPALDTFMMAKDAMHAKCVYSLTVLVKGAEAETVLSPSASESQSTSARKVLVGYQRM